MTSINRTYPLSIEAGLVEVTVTDSGAAGRSCCCTAAADLRRSPGSLTCRQYQGRPGDHPRSPGFNGTVRPDALASVAELATLYVALLDEMGLTDVTVIGNSMGGWIAAEMACSTPPPSAA